MHVVAEIIRWFSFLTSMWFVTLVSLERYLAICHPMKHRLLKGTKRTIKFCLLGIKVWSSPVRALCSLLEKHRYGALCGRWMTSLKTIRVSSLCFQEY